LVLKGQAFMDQNAAPTHLEWADRPGTDVGLDGGTISGSLSVLAPATPNGSGGAIVQAAASYNALAGKLRDQVNAVHQTGQTADGATGQQFFATDGTGPLALTLKVVPSDARGIAARNPFAGALDGSIADQVSQLGSGADSPDAFWTTAVTRIGVQSRDAQQHASLADAAQVSAASLRASEASVSLDEENISLLASQHAYQAAARVLTAVDEALDVLINRTGLVGR
jgi:flagellar hook-associated protein 1 FlgK